MENCATYTTPSGQSIQIVTPEVARLVTPLASCTDELRVVVKRRLHAAVRLAESLEFAPRPNSDFTRVGEIIPDLVADLLSEARGQ